jgi:predicted enzyme related to lactoylglutathione lyase
MTNLVSTRIITSDARRLVAFYENVTGVPARWLGDEFAELSTTSGTLAIAGQSSVEIFGAGSAHPAANRSVILDFIVDDADAEYARLADVIGAPVRPNITLPWGNRSLLFRDPDGNLINMFSAATEDAKARFADVSRN